MRFQGGVDRRLALSCAGSLPAVITASSLVPSSPVTFTGGKAGAGSIVAAGFIVGRVAQGAEGCVAGCTARCSAVCSVNSRGDYRAGRFAGGGAGHFIFSVGGFCGCNNVGVEGCISDNNVDRVAHSADFGAGGCDIPTV